jgi:hypothetical protein
MWNNAEISDRIREEGLSGRTWGFRGDEAIKRLEGGLEISLGAGLREFVAGVGNLMLAPFEVVITGDDAGRYSAVTQTRALWKCHPALESSRAVQIMDHAGQVYLYFPQDGRVCAYDSLRPVSGEEISVWSSFEQFIEWVFAEANAIAHG